MRIIMLRRLTPVTILLILFSCSKSEWVPVESDGGAADIEYKLTTYFTGDSADVVTPTQSGICLMGGSTDVDSAIAWMIERSGGGDFVVIRSSGSDGYNDYIYSDLGGVNSVETIIINSKTKAKKQEVYNKIVNAEALFIAGGDQWDYVRYWKNTKTEDAINYLINTKHAPVGGTSAGCAILGRVYFSAENGTVTSSEAMKNPYRSTVILGKNDFVNIPILDQTITDTHYDNPDRRGRHVTFLARMVQDWGLDAKGIGLDEKTAVCIDENNVATVFGSGTAHFLRQNGQGPEVCQPNTKLTWNRSNQAVKVYEIDGSPTGNGTFNLNDWSTATGGSWLYYYVDDGTFHKN
jgi:cyanophycinase